MHNLFDLFFLNFNLGLQILISGIKMLAFINTWSTLELHVSNMCHFVFSLNLLH